MDRVRRRAVVSGEVQAVGFRYSTQQKARSLGVGGWVRNLRDGTVELEAEGAAPAVDALLEWAASGPPGATVDGVDASDLDPLGEQLFDIRR